MTYTLVNAAVVGFELARLPAGPSVAQTLLTGLTADAATLLRLAGDTRVRALKTSSDHGRPLLRFLGHQLAGHPSPHELEAVLRSSRMDGPQSLDRFIRRELLDPQEHQITGVSSWQRRMAADRLVSAALDAWAFDDDVTDTTPRHGTPGWLPNLPAHHATTVDLGPQAAAVVDLLDSLAAPVTRAAWQATRAAQPTAWASAMHDACWAAHVSGRVRSAAGAQLLGVLAFRAAGFGPRDVASGAWNALSGVLQAVVVADLLNSSTRDLLLAPARDHHLTAH